MTVSRRGFYVSKEQNPKQLILDHKASEEDPPKKKTPPKNQKCATKTLLLGRHLVGVWIGGVWNGHFPESEKYFSEAEISRKIPEIPQKERFSPNFRLRNLKIQSPKKCNSIAPAVPYPH